MNRHMSSLLTEPVPQASLYLPSVGKVTILMLLRNLLRLCEYRELLDAAKVPGI